MLERFTGSEAADPWISLLHEDLESNSIQGTTAAETDEITIKVEREILPGNANTEIIVRTSEATQSIAVSIAQAPPELSVVPTEVSFGANVTEEDLTIRNSGGGVLSWTLTEVIREESGADYAPGGIAWLEATPTSGSTDNRGSNTIRLTVDGTGLAPGVYSNAGLRIHPNAGEDIVILVTLIVQVEAKLRADPEIVYVAAMATQGQVHLFNLSEETVQWAAHYLENPADIGSIAALPIGVTVSPDSGTMTVGQTATIEVSWAPEAQIEQLGFVFDSDAATPAIDSGSPVVQFVFPDTPNLELEPANHLNLYMNPELGNDQPFSVMEIRNTGTFALEWDATLVNTNNSSNAIPVAVSPICGTIDGGGRSTIRFNVINTEVIEIGSDIYLLKIQSRDHIWSIPISVQVVAVPRITICMPPENAAPPYEIVPMDTLFFGRYGGTREFYIANVGMPTSALNFRILHEHQDAVDNLIASISPVEGNTNREADLFSHPNRDTYPNVMIGGAKVSVAINRDCMDEDIEARSITIEAMDDNGIPLPYVSPAAIALIAERAPLTLEGAMNRTRPPFMMRYAFTIRDSSQESIDTWDSVQLGRLSFSILEDGLSLPSATTGLFMRGPQEISGNVALMLDFTGSMYRSGTDDPADPLAPGDALDNVRAAVHGFIDLLPQNWKMALLYYCDRQQANFSIAPFTEDREALKAALDAFSLPPALYGTSALYDAMMEGISQLADEDGSAVLPFDDADLRAMVIVTDGIDKASEAQLSSVIASAREQRVRVFPLLYKTQEAADLAPLFNIASDSGGHVFVAGDVRLLPGLLDGAGSIMPDLSRQVIIDYVAPYPSPSEFAVQASLSEEDSDTVTGVWEKEGLRLGGDIDACQASLSAEGIQRNEVVGGWSAAAYLRCDYAAPGLHRIRVRFLLDIPQDILDAADAITNWEGEAPFPVNAVEEFRRIDMENDLTVEIAEGGLLAPAEGSSAAWRLLGSGDGIWDILTEEYNALPYGASGKLLKITVNGEHFSRYIDLFEGQSRKHELLLSVRIDNDIYWTPEGNPGEFLYFVYPGGRSNPGRSLSLSTESDLAPPALEIDTLAIPEDILGQDSPWDIDNDGIPDFLDV